MTQECKTLTYKVFSALLSYPTRELQRAAKAMWLAIDDEKLVGAERRGELAHLIRAVSEADLIDAQERYVDLFDRTRSLSLHMFEHVHGESRDRGQAMVNLRERYQAGGFDLAANELPDYLPAFLEFLSFQDARTARGMLAECATVIAALAERMHRRDVNYAAIFDALIEIAHEKPDRAQLSQLREAGTDDPNDLVALDRAWEEAEVRFGPGDAKDGCPKASDMLRRMATSAPAKPAAEGAP
jgi:nitrate reductase delta subunit